MAAAALRMQGHAPMIVDLRAENDDDHVIAVFKQRIDRGRGGKIQLHHAAVPGTGLQEHPELAMSYFDFYYNTLGQKTLASTRCQWT